MAGRLAGKVACVTGIGAGIGRGCALMFAREGATVIGCDIDPNTAAATLATARQAGLALDSLHPIDMTKREDVRRYVRHAADKHGKIDILVNAGAINPQFAPVDKMDYDDIWVRTMVGETDLVFLACQEAWPHLKASGHASIINFASVVAFRASAFAGMLAHCAGKGAVLAMTRQLALEGASHKIRANTIAPGLVVTLATSSAGMTEGERRQRIIERIPLGRLGEPEDIAYCAVFLASDESSWITGQNFTVDGGTTAG